MSEKITVNGELVLTLKSKQDWVNKLPGHLPKKRYYGEDFLFIDTNGNILKMGEDFMEAEKQQSYPVSVYRLQRVVDVKK